MTTPIDPKFVEMAREIADTNLNIFAGIDRYDKKAPFYIDLTNRITKALASVATPKPTTNELRRLVRKIRDEDHDKYFWTHHILSEEAAIKLLGGSL